MIHVHVYKVAGYYADLDIDTEDPEAARQEAIAQAVRLPAENLKPVESEYIAIIQRKKE